MVNKIHPTATKRNLWVINILFFVLLNLTSFANTNPEKENPKEDRGVSGRMSAIAAVLKKPFELSERTAQFGEAIIAFCKKIPVNLINSPLINQLVKAGTNIGANFEEADDAESRKDFHHKVDICRKESRETRFFLRMIAAAEPGLRDDAAVLYREAKELNLIFGSMRRTAPKKPPRPK